MSAISTASSAASPRPTATKLWTARLEGEVYAGPTSHGDDVLFTCEAGTLTCLNKQRWQRTLARFASKRRFAARRRSSAAASMLAGCDSKLHLIDVANGKEIETVDIDGPTGSTPAMRDDRVYFGTEGGTFFAIDVRRRARRKPPVAWTYRDPQRSQPIRLPRPSTEQVVVYGSQGKAIYGLDPANGERKVEAADAKSRRELASDRRQPRSRRHRGG